MIAMTWTQLACTNPGITEEGNRETMEESFVPQASVSIGQKHVIEEQVVLEGLSKEYDLLFLTDTHVVLESWENSDEVIANAMQRIPVFQDAEGIRSSELYPAWMDYAIQQEVDGVILGGDIIDFPSLANVHFLQEQLERLEVPYVYALGNHDWTYPWDYMTESGKQEYLPMLAPMMDGNTAIESYDFDEWMLVAVDNSSGQVNPEALVSYKELLKQEKPVVLVIHVPLYTEELLSEAQELWQGEVVIGEEIPGAIRPNRETKYFIELTTAADSPVELILAGHVHFYHKDIVLGEKDILQIVGAAGYQRSAVRLKITGK